MAIQNARSNVSGRVPASLQDGQIAINQADGVLFSRNPDGTVKRNLLAKRYGVADAAFTVRAFDTYIGIASLTASRVLALPAAASYPPGQPLTIADESGAVSPTVTLTIDPNGTETVNGTATLTLATAYGGALLYSDGVSKWTALALPAGAASNALLYVQQSLTGGQQDQARANISGAMAASPSATTTLAALDFDRDQFVTGTSTITMPSAVAPGWKSGIVANTNPVTGLVTLAVPSGHSLDGTTNGVTILFPFQRARLILVAAGVWVTSWIDRAPIVAQSQITTGVASADFNLPAGYRRFRIRLSAITFSATATFGYRLSDNGSSAIKAGANDYTSTRIFGNATPNTGTQGANDSYAYLIQAAFVGAGFKFLSEFTLDPGATGTAPAAEGQSYFVDSNPYRTIVVQASDYTGTTSGTMGRANLIRFFTTAGTVTFNITITGEP